MGEAKRNKRCQQQHAFPPKGSTGNAVSELSFRVRNGFGRFPAPMAADGIIYDGKV